MQTTLRASVWDTKRWHCNSEAELEAALREYRDAEEPIELEGTGAIEGEEGDSDRCGRIYSQNRVIDGAMVAIKAEHRQAWHLLKGYYLWELWKDVNRGWHETAKMMGWKVPPCELPLRCRTANDHRYALALCDNGVQCLAIKARFLAANSAAVEVLLEAIQKRRQ